MIYLNFNIFLIYFNKLKIMKFIVCLIILLLFRFIFNDFDFKSLSLYT